MTVAAVGGSAGGAACAALLPRSWFAPLVLALLIVVGAYTLRRPALGEVQSLRWSDHRHYVVAVAAGAGIGFYDGIFGPGTGSFLTFALVVLLGYSFVQASAKARIVNLGTNLGALAVFVPHGAVLWRLGLLMAACNIVGGRLGAVTAISRGSRFVRLVFLVVVAILIGRLAWDVLTG